MRRYTLTAFNLSIAAFLLTMGAVEAVGKNARDSGDRSILNALPSSDFVIKVDIQRLLNEVLPRVYHFSGTPSDEQSRIMERFKVRTGLDVRRLDQIVIGIRFLPQSGGGLKEEQVAILHGRFKANVLARALLESLQKGPAVEPYRGKAISLVSFNQPWQILDFNGLQLSEVAIAPLQDDIIAVGDLQAVRAAIDASQGQKTSNEPIFRSLNRDPEALAAMAGIVPPKFFESYNFGFNPAANTLLTGVRQIYVSMFSTADGYGLRLTGRTGTAERSQLLHDLLKLFLENKPSNMFSGKDRDKARVLEKVLDNLAVTSEGNEIRLVSTLTLSEIASFGIIIVFP